MNLKASGLHVLVAVKKIRKYIYLQCKTSHPQSLKPTNDDSTFDYELAC